MADTTPIVDAGDEVRAELVELVRTFCRNEIIPIANRCDHADEYPADLVEQIAGLLLRARGAAFERR